MSTRTRTLPLVTLPLLLVVTGATAQQLDLQSPVPETSRDRNRHDESRTRALMPQSELYPYRPAVPYQPGFIEPLSKETATGRMGVAGWTSPNTSAGSRGAADPDNPGWPSLGFAVEWGGSPKKTMTP